MTIQQYRQHIVENYGSYRFDAEDGAARATASHLILDVFQQRLDEYRAKLKKAKARKRKAARAKK